MCVWGGVGVLILFVQQEEDHMSPLLASLYTSTDVFCILLYCKFRFPCEVTSVCKRHVIEMHTHILTIHRK